MPKAEAGGAAEIIRRVDLKSKKKNIFIPIRNNFLKNIG
jgi:hypothetical protein